MRNGRGDGISAQAAQRWLRKQQICVFVFTYQDNLLKIAPAPHPLKGQKGCALASNLLLVVFQHILVLRELFVLLRFDAFGFLPQAVGVILFQPLDGLLLLPFQVFHFLVVLALLALVLTGNYSYLSGVKAARAVMGRNKNCIFNDRRGRNDKHQREIRGKRCSQVGSGFHTFSPGQLSDLL